MKWFLYLRAPSGEDAEHKATLEEQLTQLERQAFLPCSS